LKKFVGKDLNEIDYDIFVWQQDGYISKKWVFENTKDFDFQDNTAYTKKGIVYIQ
jgi:hypothetical protein